MRLALQEAVQSPLREQGQSNRSRDRDQPDLLDTQRRSAPEGVPSRVAEQTALSGCLCRSALYSRTVIYHLRPDYRQAVPTETDLQPTCAHTIRSDVPRDEEG